MRQVGGIWITDAEEYLAPHLVDPPDYADRYNDELFIFAERLPRRRVALDVGANVGLWSRRLARCFDQVHAFEPGKDVRDCCALNVPDNVQIHPVALGDRNGEAGFHQTPSITFKAHILPRRGGVPEVPIRTLDSMGLRDVDFIKIDCEGFDYYVLLGARETLERDRPVVIFEAKPKVSLKRYAVPQEAPHDFMRSLGYMVLPGINGNYVCQP